MINGNEIASIKLNHSILEASFHTSHLYSPYDNFYKGKGVIDDIFIHALSYLIESPIIEENLICYFWN